MFTTEIMHTILALSALSVLTVFLLGTKAYMKGLLGF